MSDTEITCLDCQTTFLFTEKDQAFYEEKNFTPPKRCKPCRQVRKDNAGAGGGSGERRSYSGGGQTAERRELHDAVCSDCGVETQVPFKPSGDRPVRCRECFKQGKPRR